ncbi:MAG: type II secretion system minor pseudopilin GspH [Granulosicoccaceae bacterium]|jgi:general secretion pathway protein H
MQRLPRQAGFTLIELLVVLVIIGIISGFAVLSVGLDSEADRAEVEARRLVALMQLASDEAVLGANPLALQVDPHAYRFLSLHDQQWHLIENDAVLRERELPQGTQLEVDIEGKQIVVGKNQASARIVFLASGEISPFEMVLRTRDDRHRFRLRGELQGRIEYLGEQDGS